MTRQIKCIEWVEAAYVEIRAISGEGDIDALHCDVLYEISNHIYK